MNTKIPYWGSVICGTVAILLLPVNISLAESNRAVQNDVQQRQSIIASAQTFGQLSQFITQALAQSANNGDTQARDFLASQGIRLKPEVAKVSEQPQTKKN